MTIEYYQEAPRTGGEKTAQKTRMSWLTGAFTGAALAVAALAPAPLAAAEQSRLQAGSLSCKGDGGWGAIITSKKTFRCTFVSADGKVRGSYDGVIRKYGLDVGRTGQTSLVWLVFGPTEMVGDKYKAGALAGNYSGIGAEASVGIGVGANALVGGGDKSFALQPVSVQVQTGIGVAAAVQTLTLTYKGPLS